MKTLKGIGASAGISGVAKTFVINEEDFEVTKQTITDTESEIKKYYEAVEVAKQQIAELKEAAIEKLGEEKAAVFDAHALILLDPEFGAQIEQKINDEKVNAA
jgi:phosphotransferase system enzyme I (PtsI)